MTIGGISERAYYIFNPVWVDVSDIAGNLDLTVTLEGSYRFKYYPVDGKVSIDIGAIVKGLIPDIENKQTIFGNVDGSWNVTLSFKDNSTTENISKIFTIGGKSEFDWNIPVPNNLDISPYFWTGYPDWTSVLNSNGRISNNNIERDLKFAIPPAHDCENYFIAFRNQKGGFSKYLFESSDKNTSNKTNDVYFVDRKIKVTGVEITKSLELHSKVKRQFYDTIEQLCASTEVYWIEEFGRMHRLTGNNNVKFNDFKAVTEVNMNFEIIHNQLQEL